MNDAALAVAVAPGRRKTKRTAIATSLTKKMILPQQQNTTKKNPRITNEAIELTSELLRLFVVEARNRAAIEAECETEIVNLSNHTPGTPATTTAVHIKPSAITKIA